MTNNDAWGNSPIAMHEFITDLDCPSKRDEILQVIRDRWTNAGSTWRNLYKALTIYEYLLLHGSENFVCWARLEGRDLASLRELDHYQYADSLGKDQGINIRTKAVYILKLMQNEDELKESRREANENRITMRSRRTQENGDKGPTSLRSTKPSGMGNISDMVEESSSNSTKNNQLPLIMQNSLSSLDLLHEHGKDIMGPVAKDDEFDDFQSAKVSDNNLPLNFPVKNPENNNNLVDLSD